MKQKFVITAKNKLTGRREAISRPMPKLDAERRLAEELQARKHLRQLPHSRLRVERLQPVQLTLNFQND